MGILAQKGKRLHQELANIGEVLVRRLKVGLCLSWLVSVIAVVSVAVRYLFLALEGDNNIYALTIDPVQGYFGVGYSWW